MEMRWTSCERASHSLEKEFTFVSIHHSLFMVPAPSRLHHQFSKETHWLKRTLEAQKLQEDCPIPSFAPLVWPISMQGVRVSKTCAEHMNSVAVIILLARVA